MPDYNIIMEQGEYMEPIPLNEKDQETVEKAEEE